MPTDSEALSWIRRKLKLPENAEMFTGKDTIAGALHVLCSNAHGYRAYIKAFKCDDKQGEIARLTVQRNELLNMMKAIKTRIHFVGMPQEVMLNGRPDWSKEITMLEAVLAAKDEE